MHLLRNTLWLSFFGGIVLAWVVLYQMATGMGLDWIGRMSTDMGTAMPAQMPGEAPAGMQMDILERDGGGMGGMEMASMTRLAPLFGMWALMMAAMMLPTLVPTLLTYEKLIVSANGSRAGWLGVLAGYGIVWIGVAALLAIVQIGLLRAGLITVMGVPTALWMSGVLLIVVGAFQFTRAKAVCHGVCHAPMNYFLGHWSPGAGGGLRMGLALGAYCAGCCWGFMALGFVGGMMSLLWMGLATLFMVIEKLPEIGHYVTRPLGAALILGGVGVLGLPFVAG